LFAQASLQLRIWFNDGVHGSVALSPVQTLTPVPYAIQTLGALPAAQLTSIGNTNGGSGNFFVGPSGNSTTSGSFDTANGLNALHHEISGSYNTANGSYALFSNTNGSENTANGVEALYANTTGSDNTASGDYALYHNTNGSYNTANGAYALYASKSGNNNTADGYNALGSLTTGSGNIAVGQGAGTAIFTGNNNIDIGNTGFGDETGVIRIGTSQTKAVMLGISGGNIVSSSGLVCVNPSGLLGTVPAGGATLAGDLLIQGSASYNHLALSGGNAYGYLYGSFPALADGIHLGYNYYYDAAGAGHISNTGGGTSRITAEYGRIVVDVTTSGVAVYGTFNNSSDRNAKQDFTPVSPSEILDKVLRLPLSEWSYKTDAATRHIGPMGQDFYAAFNIGTDEKHLAPIDEGGVALAAIQGLNQKLKERDAQIQKLEEKLDAIQAVVKQLAAQK
jgi:hypothetical protein